jgi:hypothetical protein
MADTEEPLPPLDLRGLPSVDAYGNKVDLPQTDSVTGMPALTGAMPSSAPTQPAAPSTTAPTSPALPVPLSQDKPRSAGGGLIVGSEREREELNAIPAQLRPSQAPGGTPVPLPATKTQIELNNERARYDAEQKRRLGETSEQPSAGAIGKSNIVGTPNGPRLRGADGMSMPFVQDPVTGYTLPISSESSAEDFARNLDPKVRAQAIEVLSDGNDPTAQSFQRFSMEMQRARNDKNLSPRQKQYAIDVLKKEQDNLLWSSMRDPSELISSRSRQQAKQEAETERENRQSIAIQERLAKQREQQNARMYQDAYKVAKQELETNAFRPVSEDEIRNRAQQLYMQQAAQTGAMSPGSQPPTSARRTALLRSAVTASTCQP